VIKYICLSQVQIVDTCSEVNAKLIGYIFNFSLQGGPGSAGAKGESGDPGPQVKKEKVPFTHFIIHCILSIKKVMSLLSLLKNYEWSVYCQIT
jgi:hypothetical protein